MKKYLVGLASLSLLSLTGCKEWDVHVENPKFERIDKEIVMSGSSFRGDVSGDLFGFSGQVSGHSSNDMIKIPYNIELDVVYDWRGGGRQVQHRKYQVDMYFQRSEVINMARNNNLPFVITSQTNQDNTSSRPQYITCLSVKYGQRTVEITNPGDFIHECFADDEYKTKR